MTRTFLVSVKGESFQNDDGSSRQEIIRRLRPGRALKLVPDPSNPLDRWAVKVFVEGGMQVGWLPSDARDADALLKGEPISAIVHSVTGGTNWLKRLFGKKHVGLVLSLIKGEPDWNRRERLQAIARPLDEKVEAALLLDKSNTADDAIAALRGAVQDIAAFTRSDPLASAHRQQPSPIDRLSLRLERQKKYQDALKVITEWQTSGDPVQPGKAVRDQISKRAERLSNRITSAE